MKQSGTGRRLPEVDLGARLYSGKSANYRLAFDIVDAGGAATRDVRIGSSLVSFPVWAFATDSTPGSTVRVVFPTGYEVQVESGSIPDPTKDASAGHLPDRRGSARPCRSSPISWPIGRPPTPTRS